LPGVRILLMNARNGRHGTATGVRHTPLRSRL
jgi:hypothetical protein